MSNDTAYSSDTLHLDPHHAAVDDIALQLDPDEMGIITQWSYHDGLIDPEQVEAERIMRMRMRGDA